MIRLPFVQAVGRCQHWVPWTAYAKVQHLHGWQAQRTVRERLIAETFIDEALVVDPTVLETWGARPRRGGLPWGMTTAGAAAWRVVKALGMWKATPTADERAARVRVAIDRITDLRRRGLPWCAVARELRK